MLLANRKGQPPYLPPVATETGLGRYHHGVGQSCGSKVNIGGGVEHGGLNDGGVAMNVAAKNVCLVVGRAGGGRQNWAMAEECGHQDALGGHCDNHDGQILLLFLDLRGYYKEILK